MHIPLDPVTQGKIEAFARRRRRLVFRRGVCASIFAAVVALTAVALLDWCVILSEPVRLALSVAAYALVAAVIWRVWLRLLVHAPGLAELARFIETAHPPLREDLLSAVELGTEREALTVDSPVFRRLLQESVAGRITGLRPEALLPPRLIRRWVGLAAAALAVFAALFAVPELHFAQLLARAALPTANIERVSLTQVTVLEPTPPDKTVPQGDTVQIKVAVRGPAPDAVTLELLRKDAPAESLTMEPAAEALQYRAALQTDENPLRYRIRAGDAITRTYTITPRLRPYVASFDITYQDEQGKRQHVWQTSWGVSTRLVGAIVMTHGDDHGLRLPPNVAPIQAVIVPIWRKDEDRAAVLAFIDQVKAALPRDVRLHVDARDQYSPGWKYNEYEMRGVPVRLEIGPKDIAAEKVMLARRDTGEKVAVDAAAAVRTAVETLAAIQKNLFEKARKFRDEHTVPVADYAGMKAFFGLAGEEAAGAEAAKGGFALGNWCGSGDCEAKLKAETKATIRCMPLDKQDNVSGSCCLCGAPAKHRAIFARAY